MRVSPMNGTGAIMLETPGAPTPSFHEDKVRGAGRVPGREFSPMTPTPEP